MASLTFQSFQPGDISMAFQSETMNRNRQGELPHDETNNLIASDKVAGTTVFDQSGEKLGTIKNVMVGKRNGRVEYAVLSFGGLFGMGERYHPLPWDTLNYDTEKSGFVVDIDKEKLKSGPSFEPGKEPEFNRDFGEKVYGHYGRSY
ncbi:MAG TPA: PRC-barrel domain-containing protein [Sphingomicrobium sp.]|nr:PRC-barrel domain-containing protein [Sphingomicrobium sp.]